MPTFVGPDGSINTTAMPESAPQSRNVQAPNQAAASSVTSEIYEKYLRDRLANVEIPQVQLMRDELNQNAAQFAVQAALNDSRFKQLELPMADAQRQKLLSDIANTAWEQSFKNRQLDMEESLKRAGLTLDAARQVADEAIKRDTLALQSYTQAESMDMARGKQASEGYLGADEAARQREQLGASGALQAEDQTIAREKFGVDTAERTARLGLDVANANAQLRGPRNAFQQQAFNYGVNAAGLSKAVDALKGAPGVTAFQAPGAPAERATLGTIADDIKASGPGTEGESAFDLMSRSARDNVNKPIGVGTSIALDVADRNAYNPNTPNIDRVTQIADQDLSNRQGDMYNRVAGFGDKQQDLAYNSPSAQIGMEVAGKNVGEAGPVQDSKLIQGSGAAIQQTYRDMLSSRQANAIYEHLLPSRIKGLGEMDKFRKAYADAKGDVQKVTEAMGYNPFLDDKGQPLDQMNRDALVFMGGGGTTPTLQTFFQQNKVDTIPWTDPQLVQVFRTQTGLNEADARQIAEDANNFYAQNGYAIPTDRLDMIIGQRKQQTNANQYDTNYGAAGRATDAYNNTLRTTGKPYLSQDDPTLLGIYQQTAHLSPEAARKAAIDNAGIYKATGQSPSQGQMATNIGDARAATRQRWAPATGFSPTERPNYTAGANADMAPGPTSFQYGRPKKKNPSDPLDPTQMRDTGLVPRDQLVAGMV
jgi:hypothetical protein